MNERKRRDNALPLDKMKEGTLLRIVSISRTSGIGQQLAQMGIQVGDTVQIKRFASFGGPILIETRGTSLALSKEWAEKITVELVL